MSELKTIKTKMRTEEIQEQIYHDILHTPIPIGQKLPNEFDLSNKYGVSRSTVREAIHLLVAQGILEVRRGSGTYVISTIPAEKDPLGLAQIEDRVALAMDLVDVRMILEPGIAEMAAIHATEEDIRRLKEACVRVERKIQAGENYSEEDIAFHTAVAECSGNKVIEHLVPIIDAAVMVFINVTHKKLMKETIETHRAVVEAIAEHDHVGARAAMSMHLNLNRTLIKEAIRNNKTLSFSSERIARETIKIRKNAKLSDNF